MVKLYIFTITFAMTTMCSAVDFRLKNEQIEFAKAKINSVICWTQSEQDYLIDSFSQFSATNPVIMEVFSPSNFEVTLATSGIQWSSYSDFERARDEKDYLEDRLDDILPSKARKIRQSITYLKSENAKR